MEYIKLFWEGAPEGEPPVILYEVDTEHERLAFRSIDIFAGGRTPNIPVLYSQEVVASSSDITGYQATVYGLTGFTQVCWAG